ncbi:MAG: acyl-CoA thioesterase [Mucilaginibacter polytrichastri]|nr:acyl-CoA thioesterase [Mucilaginibacter polytrichastri]
MTTDKPYSIFETEHYVRPDDVDLFQHVHNSRYFDYVLDARYQQMREFYKYPMEEFLEAGFGWVVKSVSIHYKRPLVMGERFLVQTGITSMNSRGCRVHFTIVKKTGGKISADGWFDYALIDKISGKSILVSEEMITRYSI